MNQQIIEQTRVVTSRIAHAMSDNPEFAAFVGGCLARHHNGDWGDLDEDDHAANDHAAIHNERLLSTYRLSVPLMDTVDDEKPPDDRIWIITEHDRSVTTILWPSDY